MEERIKINVGGVLFETLISTLLEHDSIIKTIILYEDKTKTLRDEDGNIFFDRSPILFEIILNLLRQSIYEIKFEDYPKQKLKNIKKELKFFGLENVFKIVIKEKPKNIIPIPIINVQPIMSIFQPQKRFYPFYQPSINTQNFFAKNAIFFEDFMLGYASVAILLFSIHISLLVTNSIDMSYSMISFKLIGIGFFIYLMYHVISQYVDRNYNNNNCGYSANWYAIPGVIWMLFCYLTERKAFTHYFQLDFFYEWPWIIYQYGNKNNIN